MHCGRFVIQKIRSKCAPANHVAVDLSQVTADPTAICVRDIKGIDDAQMPLESGITVLGDRNAAHRRSLF